jgi:hypothetical protein
VNSKFLRQAKIMIATVLLTLIGCGSGAQRQSSKESAGVTRQSGLGALRNGWERDGGSPREMTERKRIRSILGLEQSNGRG